MWFILTGLNSAVPVRLICSKQISCVIHDLGENGDYFMYRYIPTNVTQIIHVNLQMQHLDESFFAAAGNVVNEVHITHSKALKTISGITSPNISQLQVRQTSLHSIQFEENNALSTLIVSSSNLYALSPTVNQLRASERIEITHSNLQAIDLATFCDLSKLYLLNLMYNRIQHIDNSVAKECSFHKSLHYLYLAQNELKTINMELFNAFSSIEFMNFRHNGLETLTGYFTNSEPFILEFAQNNLNSLDLCRWHLPKINRLSLNSNLFSSPPRCIDHLPELVALTMVNNLITNISIEAFANLDSLQTLDLSSNCLTSIELNTPHYPKSLNRIILSKNNLTSLDLSFVPVESLVVNAQANLISSFDVARTSSNNNVTDLSFAYTGLSRIDMDENNVLAKFHVANSKLARIPPTINNLRACEGIEVTNCLVQALDMGVFCDMSKLRLVNVYGNRIEYLNNSASGNCSVYDALQMIVLSRNLLKTLNMQVFDPFRTMESLTVNENRVETVLGTFGSELDVKLYLTKNKIKHINLCDWNVPNIACLELQYNNLNTVPNCLEKLKSVTDFKLSFNRIAQVSIESFAVMESLISLDLSNNSMTSIHLNSARYPSNLRNLWISGNNLTELDLTLVAVNSLKVNVQANLIRNIEVDRISPNVSQLCMAENPIDCSWKTYQERLNINCVTNGSFK
uniref:Uncharacterized protein n=1 Tax=Anopheles minimus TaxID=112268 RepID=A0A182VY79_9DIPT